MRKFAWSVICVVLFSFGLNAQKYVQIECVKNKLIISDKVCDDCKASEGAVFTGLLIKNPINGDLVEAIPYPMDLVLFKGYVSINDKNYKYPSIIGVSDYQDFYNQALSCFTCNDCDAFNEIQNVTSNDGSVTITPNGNDFDLSVQTYNVIDGGEGVDVTTNIIGDNTDFTITIVESEIDLFDIDTTGLKELVTDCIPIDLDTIVNGLSFNVTANTIELEVTNTAGETFSDDFDLVWDSGIIDTSGLKQFIVDCIPSYSIVDNGDNTYNLQIDGVDVGDDIVDRNNTYNLTEGNGIDITPTSINDFTSFQVEVDESEITLFRIDTTGLKGLITDCIPEDLDTTVNGIEFVVTDNNIELQVTDNAGQTFTDDFTLVWDNGIIDTSGLKQFIVDCIPTPIEDTNTIPQQPTTAEVDNGNGTYTTTYSQQLLDIDGNLITTLTWTDLDTIYTDEDFTFDVQDGSNGLDSLTIFDADGNVLFTHIDTRNIVTHKTIDNSILIDTTIVNDTICYTHRVPDEIECSGINVDDFTSIRVFGNSITVGAAAGADRWTTQLSDSLGLTEQNSGAGGRVMQNTLSSLTGSVHLGAGGVIPMVDFIINNGAQTPNANQLLLFAFGINDLRIDQGDNGNPGNFNITEFINDYEFTLQAYLNAGWNASQLAIVEIYYVEQSSYQATVTSGLTTEPATTQLHLQYNDALEQLASDLGIPFLRTYDYMLLNGATFTDGTHPDVNGHTVITQGLLEQLDCNSGGFGVNPSVDGNGDNIYTFTHTSSDGVEQVETVLIPDLQKCDGGDLTAQDDIWYSHTLAQADGYGVVYLDGNDCPSENDEFFDTSASSYAGSYDDGNNRANGNFSRTLNGTGNINDGGRSLIGVGQDNAVLSNWSAIVTNRNGYIDGNYSGILSGRRDTVLNQYSFVLSGDRNKSDGIYSGVGGGLNNKALNTRSIVLMGFQNTADAPESTVINGANNLSSGNQSTIAGGNQNVISVPTSFIATAVSSTINAPNSWIGTGSSHTITGTGGGNHIGSGGFGTITNGNNSGIGISNSHEMLNVNESYILNGVNHTLSNATNSTIIGGFDTVMDGVSNSVALGSARMDGTQDNSVYVPNLVINFGEATNIRPIPATSASLPNSSAGSITFDADYLYIKVDATTWKRVLLSTF